MNLCKKQETEVKTFQEKTPGTICYKHPIMSTVLITIFTFTVFFTFGILYGYSFNNNTKIVTNDGPVEGLVIKKLGKQIKVFYGIPYTQPPRRFEKPVPVNPWKETLKAIKQPKACPQTFKGIKKLVLPSVQDEMEDIMQNSDEDCLYLNVYVPEPDEKNKKKLDHCGLSQEKKTVMVYFHGGNFQYGANRFQFFDGSTLAAFGDVIVVVPNYRLGILGFLSSQPLLGGNYGLYDQLEALRWVQRNIESFGGNPENVVIFGQNAGGISAGLHLISPLSKNLFKRGIMESGTAINMHTLLSQKNAVDISIKVANDSGCYFGINSKVETDMFDENITTYSLNNDSIECLRNKPVSELIGVQEKIMTKIPFNIFTPVPDGQFLAESALDQVGSLKFGPTAETLIGSNAMEGVIILHLMADKLNFSVEEMRENFTLSTIKHFVKNKIPPEQQFMISMGLSMGFGDIDGHNSSQVWSRFVKMMNAFLHVCFDERFVFAFTASGRNVYFYQFTPLPSVQTLTKTTNWFNLATNFDEVAFVFGRPLEHPDKYSPQEQQLSKKMMKFWTQFAKKGKPEKSSLWSVFDPAKPQYMSIGLESNKMVNGLPGTKCQYFPMVLNNIETQMQRIDIQLINSMETNGLAFLGIQI